MYKFYYKQVAPNFRSFSKLLGSAVNDLPAGGRFYFNLARATGMESYIFRNGIWGDPFETSIEPQFSMPSYNSNFNLSFSEVSDLRAADIKELINSTDRPIMIQWSGGIDSTVAIVSLIKNLTRQELERITVSMSGDTALENPHFFNKFIKDKIKIVDHHKVDLDSGLNLHFLDVCTNHVHIRLCRETLHTILTHLFTSHLDLQFRIVKVLTNVFRTHTSKHGVSPQRSQFF
jgi:hypothetical protein